ADRGEGFMLTSPWRDRIRVEGARRLDTGERGRLPSIGRLRLPPSRVGSRANKRGREADGPIATGGQSSGGGPTRSSPLHRSPAVVGPDRTVGPTTPAPAAARDTRWRRQ